MAGKVTVERAQLQGILQRRADRLELVADSARRRREGHKQATVDRIQARADACSDAAYLIHHSGDYCNFEQIWGPDRYMAALNEVEKPERERA